jgi:type I pantothenate kinase
VTTSGLAAKGLPTDQLATERYSPYRLFSAERWAEFRADTPLTLSAEEIRRLRSLGDPVDLEEVKRIYLSLSRLLSAHVEASQLLFRQRRDFLNVSDAVKTPFIIGVAGSVAVGKSTTARVLKELLARWPSSPKVDLVTTDGFLYRNEVLRRENLMERKGFPDSYDVGALLRFLSGIKSGQRNVQAPVYSHLTYDVVPGQFVTIDRPDILVFEGLNVLQPRELPKDGNFVPFVSDFFDFSIYIDADEDLNREWYISRFMRLRETAFRNPDSFFHRYSHLSDNAARAIAEGLWTNINLKNLRENIKPTRPRADLILRKGPNHLVEEVGLRKL